MYSRHFLSLLVSMFCCLILQCQSDEQQPTVNIPSLGGLRGSQMVSSSGRKFQAFRGIPYAEPPVGNLRFNVRIINCNFKYFHLVNSNYGGKTRTE